MKTGGVDDDQQETQLNTANGGKSIVSVEYWSGAHRLNVAEKID